MFDMGFLPQIKRILRLLPDKKQNLLFSATFPEEIGKLAKTFLHNPVTVQVNTPNEKVEEIEESLYFVPRKQKVPLLISLIKEQNIRCGLGDFSTFCLAPQCIFSFVFSEIGCWLKFSSVFWSRPFRRGRKLSIDATPRSCF